MRWAKAGMQTENGVKLPDQVYATSPGMSHALALNLLGRTTGPFYFFADGEFASTRLKRAVASVTTSQVYKNSNRRLTAKMASGFHI